MVLLQVLRMGTVRYRDEWSLILIDEYQIACGKRGYRVDFLIIRFVDILSHVCIASFI